MGQFDWVYFYKEFAEKLLVYRNNREQLIKKVKTAFESAELKLPKLELNNEIIDIDPFTVMGLFNKNAKNRVEVIKAFANEFEINAVIPESFDSIPVLNNQNATFYYFKDQRNENDIKYIWDLFYDALNYVELASHQNEEKFCSSFDSAINIKGNGTGKITMGLYWIAPEFFLNLDNTNKEYIYKSGNIPTSVVSKLPSIEGKVSATTYITIIKLIKDYLNSNESTLKNLKELSYAAWKYGKPEPDKNETVNYWLYAPGEGANMWDQYYDKGIMGIGWGNISSILEFENKAEIETKLKSIRGGNQNYSHDSLAAWEFCYEITVGDIIFVKKGRNQIIDRGVVVGEYTYLHDQEDVQHRHIREVNWTNKGEYDLNSEKKLALKTLTKITSQTTLIEKINKLFEDDIDTGNSNVEPEQELKLELELELEQYTKENFLKDVFMDELSYSKIVDLIRLKKNVILQGAPGVGKTYAAKRLAYSIMGEINKDRVMLVQFHQSYTYEDFIEGYRPSSIGDGFEIKKGSFYNFCKKACDDLENDYFFIIDEINRGNLSKIFGELFMLIESDKRGQTLQLLYSDEKFNVPKNVYIIGMMNTADRSLAMLDYALRRRFAFYTMNPAFTSLGFIEYKDSHKNEKFNRLLSEVEKLNEKIISDDSLGEGFCIGHSYFCNLHSVTDIVLSNIVEYELIPLLKEYWFDDSNKVKEWSVALRSALK